MIQLKEFSSRHWFSDREIKVVQTSDTLIMDCSIIPSDKTVICSQLFFISQSVEARIVVKSRNMELVQSKPTSYL